MSFQKFKSDSYCVGGSHKSNTVKIYGDITSKGSKVLIGFCSKCQIKKSMTVSDNTIEAEGLSDFFKNLGKTSVKVGKKLAKNVLKILHEPWILLQTLLVQLQVDLLKMYYQHYLK